MPPAATTLAASPQVASTSSDTLHKAMRSPYRFVPVPAEETEDIALHPHDPSQSRSRLLSPTHPRPPTYPIVTHAYPTLRESNGLPSPATMRQPPPATFGEWCVRMRPWIPFAVWLATTIGFWLAIAFWRTELFTGLDHLSQFLKERGVQGYAMLGVLIFITTFPPLPLYSTLMTLSGYCFGAMPGAVLSYVASLTGALVVFLLARAYARDWVMTVFSKAPSLRRAVRAVEKRPNVLFLVRLAPYPYNLMNVLLAASPTLTLRTYTICTALSLFKVIIHTSIGAGIRSFADHASSGHEGDQWWAQVWTGLGIALCVGLFIYLAIIARRAVDEELHEEEASNGAHGGEESVAFLRDMAEAPSSPTSVSVSKV